MHPNFQTPGVSFLGRDRELCLDVFALQEQDLRGRSVLDCPSGPDALVATSADEGCDIRGCDPMYGKSADEMQQVGPASLAMAIERMRSSGRSSVYRDFDGFARRCELAMQQFVADYRKNRHRYVAASLPSLPFADREFDLVLSANFLFVYAPHDEGGILGGRDFDLSFHLAAVAELARVTRHELRLAPVGALQGKAGPHPYRDRVAGLLMGLGFATRLVPSRADLGTSGHDEVLVAVRA